MLYLFYGEDSQARNSAHDKFVKTLPKDAEVFSIGRDNFDKAQIETLYSGAGLFSPKLVVLLSGILEKEDSKEFILEKLGVISTSSNYFVFKEGKLLKPILDAFKKAKGEISAFEEKSTLRKTEKFNSFLLANALGSRDKLNLWIYFRQAMDQEVSLEELVGVLFWKAKDMLLKKTYGKFSKKELEGIASKLSYLLPQARGSGKDAEAALEQFLLSSF